MENLALVVMVAEGCGRRALSSDLTAWLSRYRHLRIYHPHLADRDAIESSIAGQFPCIESLEWVHAHLCRPELRVEIEGVAQLGDSAS